MDKANISIKEITYALENDEFVFYYQPKVSMITGEIHGAEALIRWQKPDGALISPADFLPLAETTGFINEITLAMFQKLIIDINIINDTIDSLILSFNTSAKDFHNNKLIEAIRYAVEHKLVNADLLEVELTETVLLDEQEDIRHRLNALNDMGINLAMDDYGTGFSSIDTLAKWPFSTIKLDQGLIIKLDESDKSFSIIQSSIQMAHQLELDVVAEGIETENAYLVLQRLGCSIAQGCWLSRPLSLADFLIFCKRGIRWPSEPMGSVYMAQLDHIHWRKAIIDGVFYIGLRDNNPDLRGLPESDPRKCMLGKWYYGLGKIYTGKKWYDMLEEPHNRLHKIGDELLEAAKKNASKDELILLMRKLTKQSTIVVSLLQEIENELVSVAINDDTN